MTSNPHRRVCHYCKLDLGPDEHQAKVRLPGIIKDLKSKTHLMKIDDLMFFRDVILSQGNDLDWFGIERLMEITRKVESDEQQGERVGW